MVDLRHPDLRFRDVNRVVLRHWHELQWEAGLEPTNEWVVASLEDDQHRRSLLSWLASKNVAPDSDAFLFWSGDSQLRTVYWRDLLAEPQRFFGERRFRVVSKDLSWALEYWNEGTARFGRQNARP